MSVSNKIISLLNEKNINTFLINEYTSSTEELFFIKKDLVQSRNKNVTKCEVTVYNDFEKDGVKMRGSSSFFADLTMSSEELSEKINTAFTAAHSVCNPYYELPVPCGCTTDNITKSQNPTSYTAGEIAEIIFNSDKNDDAFVNSLEVFVESKDNHIINSNGIDVSFSSKIYSGEFVVQCKLPKDVELYQDFKYYSKDSDISSSLEELLHNNLRMIKDRAKAVPSNTVSEISNCKNIILEGSSIYELFNYYLERLDASMIYPGYSNYKSGDIISTSINPENHITIVLTPKVPYSSEGIAQTETVLIDNNIAKCITGNSRFSYYLGIPATGNYESYKLNCGKTDSKDLFKNEPYLKICSFSDFQMNSMTGQFGGEFRLAYYFDGIKEIPVTNGSISGNINDILSSLVMSKDTQKTYYFDGPLSIGYTQ